MLKNNFFNNRGPFTIDKLLKLSGIFNSQNFKKKKIFDIKDISSATNKEITFFHSIKYKDYALKTKASYCVTTNKLKNFLPKKCHPIISENVLLSMAKITKLFYPDAVNDNFCH